MRIKTRHYTDLPQIVIGQSTAGFRVKFFIIVKDIKDENDPREIDQDETYLQYYGYSTQRGHYLIAEHRR